MSDLGDKLITDLGLEPVEDGRVCTIALPGKGGTLRVCGLPGKLICKAINVVLCDECLRIATDIASKKHLEKTASPNKAHGIIWRSE